MQEAFPDYGAVAQREEKFCLFLAGLDPALRAKCHEQGATGPEEALTVAGCCENAREALKNGLCTYIFQLMMELCPQGACRGTFVWFTSMTFCHLARYHVVFLVLVTWSHGVDSSLTQATQRKLSPGQLLVPH